MIFSELQTGSRFRCKLETANGSALVDCVKLSPKRFRRLDSGKYVKPDSSRFPVILIPIPDE